MSKLEAVAPNYKLAVERWPDAPNLSSQYADLSHAFENSSGNLVELCKSFIEMICITVLKELGKQAPKNGQTNEYLGQTLDALGIKRTEGASSFNKILSSYNKLADAISDVRNHEGRIAHGKDSFLDSISKNHARVYLLTADLMISLIMDAFDGTMPHILFTREAYERFSLQHLHEKIDAYTHVIPEVDEYDGSINLHFEVGTLDEFDIKTSASQILYYVDRTAYVNLLEQLQESPPVPIIETDADLDPTVIDQLASTQGGLTSAEVEHNIQLLNSYDGIYAGLANNLSSFIAENLKVSGEEGTTTLWQFTYTILCEMESLAIVDWEKRASTLSQVRRMIKRVFRLSSLESNDLDSLAVSITEWLIKNFKKHSLNKTEVDK
jgi:hypothetical protein